MTGTGGGTRRASSYTSNKARMAAHSGLEWVAAMNAASVLVGSLLPRDSPFSVPATAFAAAGVDMHGCAEEEADVETAIGVDEDATAKAAEAAAEEEEEEEEEDDEENARADGRHCGCIVAEAVVWWCGDRNAEVAESASTARLAESRNEVDSGAASEADVWACGWLDGGATAERARTTNGAFSGRPVVAAAITNRRNMKAK